MIEAGASAVSRSEAYANAPLMSLGPSPDVAVLFRHWRHCIEEVGPVDLVHELGHLWSHHQHTFFDSATVRQAVGRRTPRDEMRPTRAARRVAELVHDGHDLTLVDLDLLGRFCDIEFITRLGCPRGERKQRTADL